MNESEVPLARLQAAFDLGTFQDVEPLAGGKSQHYLVTTTLGRYMLRRSYRSKALDAVRFEHELVDHLRARGFPGPEFVPTVDGDACAVIDGRLWRMAVFVAGTPARVDHPGHLEAVAETLARYHQLVAGFTARVPVPPAPLLPEALRERLAAVATLAERRSGATPAGELDASLRFALEEGEPVLARLEELYASLPLTTIHAGCRRGSALFDGDRLLVVLDFDSAHREARALDVAVAVHDFAKVYGDPASPDYKVHLDPDVATRFVRAYQQVERLEGSEVEAVPLLLVAKRLKRALGRYGRLLAGDPLSGNDLRKIDLELARVRSLRRHDGLVPALASLIA